MARKISEEAANALFFGRKFTKGNTRVRDGVLYLFNRKIAWYDEKFGLIVSDGNYGLSVTTKDRLNALNDVKVWTKKGVDYILSPKGEPLPWKGNPWVVDLGVYLKDAEKAEERRLEAIAKREAQKWELGLFDD